MTEQHTLRWPGIAINTGNEEGQTDQLHTSLCPVVLRSETPLLQMSTPSETTTASSDGYFSSTRSDADEQVLSSSQALV